MPRGRKPIAPELKMVRGTAGQKLLSRTVSAFGELKEPPAYFDGEQCTVWRYAIEHAPPGVLKMADQSILETWVTSLVMYRRAVVASDISTMQKASGVMMRATEHLGFSPMSRARVKADTTPNLGGWDEVKTGS